MSKRTKRNSVLALALWLVAPSWAHAQSLEGVARVALGGDSSGTILTFDAPGGGTAYQQGTTPQGINPAREITGYYIDAQYSGQAWVRQGGCVLPVSEVDLADFRPI